MRPDDGMRAILPHRVALSSPFPSTDALHLFVRAALRKEVAFASPRSAAAARGGAGRRTRHTDSPWRPPGTGKASDFLWFLVYIRSILFLFLIGSMCRFIFLALLRLLRLFSLCLRVCSNSCPSLAFESNACRRLSPQSC